MSAAAAHPAVAEFFDSDEWVVDVDERGVTLFAVRGDAGEWYGQVWWLVVTEQLLVYSTLPFPVPEDRRHAVADVMGRINARLSLANFEVDLTDGESRCRNGIAVAEDRLDADIVRRAVHANVHATDRYLPAIVRVVNGADPATIDLT